MARKRSRPTKLELTIANLHHRFGPQSVVQGRSFPAVSPRAASAVSHIPTGFAALDEALGIGGLPRGKISELIGLPTSGKTTLALKFLQQAQTNGDIGYIDQARYFDADYAHRCGVDLARLVVGDPYGPTEALAMAEALLRDGELSALVFDTMGFAWATPETSRQLADWLGRLSAPLSRAQTALLFLYDDDATSSHLSVLAHVAAVRLHLTRERWQRKDGDIRGYEARVEVLKNRFAPAGRTVTISIAFNGTVHGNGL